MLDWKMCSRPCFHLTGVSVALGCALFAVLPSGGRAQTSQAQPAWDEFRRSVQPFFAQHCHKCHGEKEAENDVRFDLIRDEAALKNGGPILEKALKNLSRHKMPPADEPQPPAADVARVVAWLKTYLSGDESAPINPGRVTIRRLTRAEYNNTLRDLLGIELRLADNFPTDEASFGFDNNGDALSLAPLLMEKYLAAAGKAVEAARTASRLPQLPANVNKREAAEKSIRSFASRAYRRPASDVEVTHLMTVWGRADADGRAFERSLDVALQAVLVSPHFLYRIELEPQPGETGEVHTLNEFELATRLSYFLWSSMPDDELFALAGKGGLRANLPAQIRRMLKDPKSSALGENFAGQWLQLRAMRNVAPDPMLFPEFSEPLRLTMTQETELFFKAIVQEDRSVLDFIDADFTYMNERLAKHYGVSGVRGENFRRVSLAGTQRGGVLTHASILTLTSQPG
ncbi:MAG: DUF1592 domain-containing protein, partial [Opitutaceae bacterium]